MIIGQRMRVLVVCVGFFVLGTYSQEIQTKDPVPKTVSSAEPKYGDSVTNYGMAGAVTISVQIDKTGKATVQSAFGPLARCSDLDAPEVAKIRKAVTDAAAATVFEPPTKDGKPVDVYVNLTYRFAPAGLGAGKPFTDKPTTIQGGVLNRRYRKLPPPSYPPAARADRASGAVTVQVLLLENGDVFTAGAVSGHPLLRQASVEAACRAKFDPTTLNGVRVKVSGVIVYNYVP